MSIHDRVARYAAPMWGDLSADEIDALYQQLHRKGRRSIYISCNRAECSALANSFDQLFKRLGWPSTIGEGGILALGVTGIQVNPNDDTARLLKSAIEARTKIKVDVSGIPRQPGDLNPTMLVIGPKYEKYSSPKPGDRDIGTGAEAGDADVVFPVADRAARPVTLQNILADFQLLDDWEDRYRYVIELGRALPPLPEAARTEANKVGTFRTSHLH
jgi:Fe-S metabolism associated domain